MAEFAYDDVQSVGYLQAARLNPTRNVCNKGYIFFDEETGLIILRGVANNPCAKFSRYYVIAGSNIAVPTGGTVGEISQSLAIAGTPVQPTLAAATPAAVQQFNNVTSFRYIDVPVNCCYFFSVVNTSSTQEAIDMRNLNVSIVRTA